MYTIYTKEQKRRDKTTSHTRVEVDLHYIPTYSFLRHCSIHKTLHIKFHLPISMLSFYLYYPCYCIMKYTFYILHPNILAL